MTTYAPVVFTSDGSQLSKTVPWPYESAAHVAMTVDGEAYAGTLTPVGSTVTFSVAPAIGLNCVITRTTAVAVAAHEFVSGSITAADLNKNQRQVLYAAEEAREELTRAVRVAPGADLPPDLTFSEFVAAVVDEVPEAALSVIDTAREAAVEAVQAYAATFATDNIVSQFNAGAPPDQPCVIIQTAAGYELYSPLGLPGFWDCHRMERTGTNDYRPTFKTICAFADVYHVIFDSFTTSGSFSGVANSSALGGYYKYSQTTGNYVEKEITVTGPATVVSVIYNKRVSANHIAVTIDGAGTLVNLLPTNGAGEKYIDPYDVTATTPTVGHRAAVAILPEGTYTIRLTNSTQKNASATAGAYFYPLGLAALGTRAGLPGGSRTHAPQWITGESVTTSYQRWNEGVTYRATTTGTTGATPPTHTTGSVSDGTVTWDVVTDTYALFSEVYVRNFSEPLWAMWIALNGQSEEDFGGAIHGNTAIDSLTVYVDGYEVSLTPHAPLYGRNILVRQVGYGFHTAAPATRVFEFTQDYGALPGGDNPYSVWFEANYSGLRGTFHPAMVPLYHYHVDSGFRYQMRKALIQNKAGVRPSAYYGQANPKYGETSALQLGALVDIGSTAGVAGVPATDKEGQYHLAITLEVTRDSLDDFTGADAMAYWDMNTAGVDVSAGGYTGMASKGYFRASAGSTKKVIAAGDRWSIHGVYRTRIFRGSAGEP